ncbi:MAG: hypothetical protein DI551_10835 [Micavibrio aeruginosavorus]|uniref:Uncharacterized protein n=1 Tax=Micavibrio aeruginosavorus TaxID=349221 RepID=A0A2W5PYF6_9BACT|nr:MAG: hypothetical protein DI551_10835 [Micavibrio aeruginosavorus]
MSKEPLSEYKQNAKIIEEIEARLAAVEKAEWEKIKNDHKGAVDNLRLKTNRYCYPKKPDGFGNVIPAIAERLTWRGYPSKTQSEITEEVRALFPKFKIPLNIWQKRLNRWEMKAVKTKIDGNMTVPVRLDKCETLSDIKTVLKAHANIEHASFSFKARISLDKKNLVAGNKTYPISMRKSGRYKYPSIRITTAQGKRVWLRLDAMIQLFIK